MRVLLLGASGFIGREAAAALRARGHEVVSAIRAGRQAFDGGPAIAIDLETDTTVEAWMPRLANVDAVVNCAGVLQAGAAASMEAIHVKAPAALFEACERAGVRRVVHVSAISADRDARTAYASTKLECEERLRASTLEWVVLRPSLVHARGAYGGTAALRALASFPFFIPVPGDGSQPFQPIWIDDLCAVIALAIETDRLVRKTVDPVGPDLVTLREVLVDYRRWLGFPAARIAAMPRWVVHLVTRLADRLGGTLNSTALAQLEHGNAGDAAAYVDATGLRPLGWRQALARHPAHAQDRWHARMYLVRPILRATLAFLWLVSGFAGLFALREWTPLLARDAGVGFELAGLALIVCCVADIVIGVLVARRWRPRPLAAIQAVLIVAYTLAASLLWPSLWAEALAPLAKNLPIAAAALALGAIEEER